MAQFLALVESDGSMAYCTAFTAYLFNAKNAEDAKVRVQARYGKSSIKFEIVPVEKSKERGTVAEVYMEICE